MFLVEMFYRPLHLHEEPDVILVLKGTRYVTVHRNTFPVSPSDILLLNSGEIHKLRSRLIAAYKTYLVQQRRSECQSRSQ